MNGATKGQKTHFHGVISVQQRDCSCTPLLFAGRKGAFLRGEQKNWPLSIAPVIPEKRNNSLCLRKPPRRGAIADLYRSYVAYYYSMKMDRKELLLLFMHPSDKIDSFMMMEVILPFLLNCG